MDTNTEREIQNNLQEVSQDHSTLIIAHRLSTIRRANRIVVLSDGRVQEVGNHQELILRKGVYWKLYNLQFSEKSVVRSYEVEG